VGAKDLAGDRFRLLLEQLLTDKSQREVARVLGLSQGSISFYMQRQREPEMEAIGQAIDRLHIRPSFFFDASLENPRYTDFLGTHLEEEWKDTDAWVELERNGRIDDFRRDGVPEETIQRVRRWKWRGPPKPRDYERLLEADLLGARGEPARELEEARARRRSEGKPDLALKPSTKARKKS
jgi:transcriptional regulator with XRE-family HTH domain